MAYDEKLDKVLRTYDLEFQGKTYVVGIVSYNNGPEKVAVSEKSVREPKQMYSVKRMTIPLLLEVADLIKANEPDQSDPFAEGGEG